nr:DNA polymerase, mitochondrial [Tanacetum cinerariifolium]
MQELPLYEVLPNLKENLNGVNLEDDTKYSISEFFKNFFANLEHKAELIKEVKEGSRNIAKNKVFDLLKANSPLEGKSLTKKEKVDLQQQVEELTLTQRIDRTLASVPEKPIFQMPFRYMCQAMLTYSKENPPLNDEYTHSIAAMDLINQYIYPRIVKGYAKVSIIFTVKKTMGEVIQFSLKHAVPLTNDEGVLLSKSEVFSRLFAVIKITCELYEGDIPLEILVKGYCTKEFCKTARYKLSIEKRSKILQETIDKGLFEFAPIKAKEIRHKKKIYSHITTLKEVCKETKPFIVADLVTILVKDIHKPYAAGLMVVRPGEKKDIEHASLNEDNLKQNKEEIVEYLRQDVLLLGGKDTEGHADAYIPYGENLYYYDVNSLYPFVMKEYLMPGGKARRIDSIKEEHLDTMLGFVLAYVECPTDIKRPFLPYRDATGTLIFPTDTDSVVLGNLLNEEELSLTELGKFKEEAQIKVGYFLAPKQYYY